MIQSRHHRRPLLGRSTLTAVALATVAVVAPTPMARAEPSGPAPAASAIGPAAGRWLAEEYRWDVDAVAVPASTAGDALLAWAATGSEHSAAQRLRATTVATISSRTGLENISRVLLPLAIYGEDPTDVNGRNLDADLRALYLSTGVNEGRFKATTSGSTPSNNVILHARAMLALRMTAGGAPAAASTALAATQCVNGSFPTTFGSTSTCGNLEASALAAQALRSAGATADAAEAEAWILSVQAVDGTFTPTVSPANGVNTDLVGLAAQTLRSGGHVVAADTSAAYIEAQALLPDAPVRSYDIGAIAQKPVNKTAALDAGEIPLGSRFGLFRNSTMRAVLGLGAPALVDLDPPPVSEAPEEPVRWHRGACAPDEGVNVVVDFTLLVPERIDVRCALGHQISGWAALVNAGYPVGSVSGSPGSAICTIDGQPTAGFPTCWFGSGSEQDGTWSYWSAPNTAPGTSWNPASAYNSTKPALNGVEGSRYGSLLDPAAPPAIDPQLPAPEVTITSAPSGTAATDDAEVAFTVDDPTATVERRVDGGGWDETTSPLTLTDLTQGSHTVDLRATNTYGTVGTLASATWTVDTVAPVVTFTTRPPDSTVDTVATLDYEVDDPAQIAEEECRVDAGAWGACPSPWALTGLTAGAHTAEVRVTDEAGNVGTGSAAWTVVAPRSSHAAWVWAAYQDFLGREPEPAEVTAAVTRLDGGTPRSVLARELATSDAWLTELVTDLYNDTLGREPDAGGLTYWTEQLRSGRMTVARVAAHFYGSAEYDGGIDGGMPQSWVTDLYDALLDRAPDQDGLDFWTDQIAIRGRAWVAFQMFQSLESRRARVTRLYHELLGRAPEPSGRDFWAGRITTAGDIRLAIELAISAEYLTRAQARFP